MSGSTAGHIRRSRGQATRGLASAAFSVWVGLSAASAADSLPSGNGRDIVYGRCQTCHSVSYITDSSGLNRSQWDSVLHSMRRLGMPALEDKTRDNLLDYLSTYLGPEPPPEATAASPAENENKLDGGALYRQQCASCHQVDGSGVKGRYPPLAGNSDLFLSRDYPVAVALHGLKGKIEVHGRRYEAEMPSFAHLSDRELVAIIRYIRTSWTNAQLRPPRMAAVDAGLLAQTRQRNMTPEDVHTYRAKLK